jgi:hypothetical protein
LAAVLHAATLLRAWRTTQTRTITPNAVEAGVGDGDAVDARRAARKEPVATRPGLTQSQAGAASAQAASLQNLRLIRAQALKMLNTPRKPRSSLFPHAKPTSK